MRRNRRNNAKKERIIMIASSAFVLAALTLTGIYMKSNQVEPQDDGYTIDFTALEDNVQDKLQEIAQNNQTEDGLAGNVQDSVGTGQDALPLGGEDMVNLEDDLDYTPMEVGSGQVELPGVVPEIEPEVTVPDSTDILDKNVQPQATAAPTPEPEPEPEPEATPKPEPKKESETVGTVVANSLHFAEENGLFRPLNGEVMIPYSMDRTVRFETLDQYKCNSALMIAAEAGTTVTAAAEGKVVRIFDDAEIGHALTMELGDGYELTYGQLEGINVTLDSYVAAGDPIAVVAEPTKYYCRDGSNLYMKLTKDGEPVNPEPLFR